MKRLTIILLCFVLFHVLTSEGCNKESSGKDHTSVAGDNSVGASTGTGRGANAAIKGEVWLLMGGMFLGVSLLLKKSKLKIV